MISSLRTMLHDLADAPDGLVDAHLVFDQGKTHVLIAVFAEPEPGRNRHLGLADQESWKTPPSPSRGTAPGFWPRRTWCPWGWGSSQPDAVQAGDQGIAALLVGVARFRLTQS